MAHILITGGSGSIGRSLIPKLRGKGYSVSVIGRSVHKNLDVPSYTWDLQKGTLDERALKDVTHIVHLAGAGIADKPWSPARKQEIIESRVKPLQLLSETLKKRNQRIEAIISSSAVGYYGGITSEKVFTEVDAPANDFLGSTCRLWEDAVQSFKPVADREVRVRTGIVLMKSDGALPKLALPVRFGVGAAIGSGKQLMPWIHIDDMTSVYLHAIENRHMHGAYNAVSPESATQTQFIQKIGKSLKRPVFLPSVPRFLVSSVMGEMSKVITEGSRVSSQKIVDSGFEFKHIHLQEALNDLLQ